MSALGGILIALVLYGAYQFYFRKPTPIVNNTVVQSGGKIDVQQGKTQTTSSHLITGLSVGRNEIMGTIAWLW